MASQIYWLMCTRTGSRLGPRNSLLLYLGETIGVQPVSTRRLALYKLLSGFALLYTLYMSKFYMPTFVNHWNNSKTAPISFYNVRLSILGKPVFVYISAIFSAVNTYVTPHRIACSASLTSFVRVGSINMLTNRPCHGPWTVNVSRRFCSVSSPNVVSGVLGFLENIGINSS